MLRRPKGIAAELAAVGYVEPVAGKPDTWRNTDAGDMVAGAKEPRLTRATADKAVRDFLDRVNQVNADDGSPLRVAKVIAFGGYTTEHQRIQDVEVAVALEPKRRSEIAPDQERDVLKFLKGRGRALQAAKALVCEYPQGVLAAKGQSRQNGRSAHTSGRDRISPRCPAQRTVNPIGAFSA